VKDDAMALLDQQLARHQAEAGRRSGDEDARHEPFLQCFSPLAPPLAIATPLAGGSVATAGPSR
jgi:hypothetical protein